MSITIKKNKVYANGKIQQDYMVFKSTETTEYMIFALYKEKWEVIHRSQTMKQVKQWLESLIEYNQQKGKKMKVEQLERMTKLQFDLELYMSRGFEYFTNYHADKLSLLNEYVQLKQLWKSLSTHEQEDLTLATIDAMTF